LTRTRWLAGEWDHGAALSRPVSFPATSVSQSSRGLVSRRSRGRRRSNDAELPSEGITEGTARGRCVSQGGETVTRDVSRRKNDSSLFCPNDDARENRGEEKCVRFNVATLRKRERERGEGPFVTFRLCDIHSRDESSVEATRCVCVCVCVCVCHVAPRHDPKG